VDVQLAPGNGQRGFLGVLYLDLAGFKAINDTYGHRAGDLTFHTVSDRMRNALPGGDIVVRMGGDELAIFMPELESREQLKSVAERLLAQLQELIMFDGKIVRTGASIGGVVTSIGAANRASLFLPSTRRCMRRRQEAAIAS
jgi:diguanylate cyclase (GGDEF)-like protein